MTSAAVDSSSDDDDLNDQHSFTGPNGAPFLLQVPPTFENKQRSGNHSSLSAGRDSIAVSNSTDSAFLGNTKHRRSNRRARNASQTLFEDLSLIPSCYTSRFGDGTHGSSTSRPAPPPVEHRFKVMEPAQLKAFFCVNRKLPEAPDHCHSSNSRFIPAVVVPTHHAPGLDLASLIARSTALTTTTTALTASGGACCGSAATTSSSSQQLRSGVAVGTGAARTPRDLIELAKQVPPSHALLACRTPRAKYDSTHYQHHPLPPPFSSVKVAPLPPLFLEDRDVEQKLARQQQGVQARLEEIHHRSPSKLTSHSCASSRQSNASSLVTNNNNNNGGGSSSSCNNRHHLHRHCSPRDGGGGGNNARARKHAVVQASAAAASLPSPDDYIESDELVTDPLYCRKELGTFDRFTLPPILDAEKHQKEALGKRDSLDRASSFVSDSSAFTSSLNGRDLLTTTSLENGSASASATDVCRIQKVAGANAATGEAATARVARTLFLAGLCSNLAIYELLRQMPLVELEKKLNADFVHRRQVSKEDFAAFLCRALHQDCVNRREVDLLFSLLDPSSNGIVETKELRTELLKFVQTGTRDISFLFVASLLEGRDTHAVNAFISRFDIQNIVRAVVHFYKDDQEIVSAVSSLADAFKFQHHLARIPVAQFRDKIISNPMLLSIFQAVALEAKKSKSVVANTSASATASLGNPAGAGTTASPNGGALTGRRAIASTQATSSTAAKQPVLQPMSPNSMTATIPSAGSPTSAAVVVSPRFASTISNGLSRATATAAASSSGAESTNPSSPTNKANGGSTQLSNNSNNNNSGSSSLAVTAPAMGIWLNVGGRGGGAAGSSNSINDPIEVLNPSAMLAYGKDDNDEVARFLRASVGGGGDSQQHGSSGSSNVNKKNNSNNNSDHHKKAGTGAMLTTIVEPNASGSDSGVASNLAASINGTDGASASSETGIDINNNDNSNNKSSGQAPLTRRRSFPRGPAFLLALGNSGNFGASVRSLGVKRSVSGSPNLPRESGNLSSGAAASATIASTSRVSNSVTVADRFAVSDSQRQCDAKETGEPQWFTRANVLYVVGPDGQARPVFQPS